MKRKALFATLLFFLNFGFLFGQTRPNVPITGVPSQPFASLREVMLSKTRGWDLGVAFGTAHSLADIGGTRDASRILFLDAQWPATGIHYGVFARYRFSDVFALNAGLNYGHIGGADSLSPVTSSRFGRGYYFENNLYELALKTELYFPSRYLNIPLQLYAYTGFIILYHDPKLTVTDPDNFEPASFSLVQPVIPFGLGLHYTSKGNFRIGYNIGWRKTFTDYLDALAPAPGPQNDAYFFNAINLGYYWGARMKR
jgi:hypothetical protein